jgi:thiol-disulfide isomerase/thioredoxin
MKNKLALFYSPTCEPCQHQKPLVEKISKKYKIPLELINVDTKEGQEHAALFNIKGWPHLFFIVEDTVKEEMLGYNTGVKAEDNEKRLENELHRIFKI